MEHHLRTCSACLTEWSADVDHCPECSQPAAADAPSQDPRLSPAGPTRWAAVRATKTRCRHCYADIVQLRPAGRWRDVESEAATCAPNLHHEPMPHG